MKLWNAVAKPFKNIHRIFPTQQVEIAKMINVCKNYCQRETYYHLRKQRYRPMQSLE